MLVFCQFFFFKQKTAYEMQRGLVGSEMCIRDSSTTMEIINKKGEINAVFLTFKKVLDFEGNPYLNVLILGNNSEVKLHKDILNYMSVGIVVTQIKTNKVIFINNAAKQIIKDCLFQPNSSFDVFSISKANKILSKGDFAHTSEDNVYEKKCPSGIFLEIKEKRIEWLGDCLLYTSPSPRDLSTSRMPSSA
eukprot:TRINITY_DN53010_c0_g1_i1.p1 TRINITY_DN53010_c0_g1~~TRINITY_DN53010_c0_g1_i1.p1  ORF type:complete len:191 (+),score=47.27 TRINITY_DN53010_c0_g1_i1:47-619(+)